jgi:hypothetical protein
MAFVPSKLYGFVRSRQLEGTYPGVPGTGTSLGPVFEIDPPPIQ